jgi:hypothetical protein
MSAGMSSSQTGSLTSATSSDFYQVSLTAGVDATITLDGMQAGSDFDLFIYRADMSSIGCSQNRGTTPESVQTQFGSAQTVNSVIVEVRPHTWVANASIYTLKVSSPAPATTTGQNTQSTGQPILQPRVPLQAQANCPPATSGIANPSSMGTFVGGTSASVGGSLSSSNDSRVFRFNLIGGVEATISLTGMHGGSDFDLYAYRGDLTPIGCSINRGTTTETVKTSFGGGTQSLNAVIVQVRPHAWDSGAPQFTLSLNATGAANP